MTQYAMTDMGRIFLFLDGSINVCTPEYAYTTCTKIAGWNVDLGDVQKVECPDPYNFQEFVQVDEILGTESRWTNSATTRMPLDEESPIRAIARWKTKADMHVNFGTSGDPGNINSFTKKTIATDVKFTNYTSTELTALSSDERAQITESSNISARYVYDVYNLRYTLQTNPSTVATAKSVVIPPALTKNKEGQIIFVMTSFALLYWNNGVVSSQAFASNGGAARVGRKIMVSVPSTGVSLVDWDNSGQKTAISYTVAGIGATIGATEGGAQYGFVGAAKKIYRVDSSGNVLTIDLSSSMPGVADAIVAIGNGDNGVVVNDGNVVAADSVDRVFASFDYGATWSQATTPTLNAGESITSIYVKSDANWLLGTSGGQVLCTEDSGSTYSVIFTAPAADSVKRIVGGAGNHVIFYAIGSAVYRSTTGGSGPILEPSKSGTTFPAMTSIADIALSPDNVNIIAVTGLVGGGARLTIGKQ